MLAFFTITHLDTSGAFSRTLAQREPRDCPWMQYLESVLRCRVAQPPGVAQQVHKVEGSVDAVAPLSRHWGLQPGATTTCDTLRAGEKALGFFSAAGFLIGIHCVHPHMATRARRQVQQLRRKRLQQIPHKQIGGHANSLISSFLGACWLTLSHIFGCCS